MRRVVITAMGCVTPLGNSPDAIRHAVRNGITAFTYQREHAHHEAASAISDTTAGHIISPVSGFDLRDYTGPWKLRKYLPRGAQFAVAAALDAATQSRINATAKRPSPQQLSAQSIFHQCGLFVGVGPNLDMGADFPVLTADHTNGNGTLSNKAIEGGNGMDHPSLSALWLLRYLPNTTASAISQRLGLHGENATITTACAASLQAIGEAFRKIRHGYLDCALAGGGDSRLSEGALLGYSKAGALFSTQGNSSPTAKHSPKREAHSLTFAADSPEAKAGNSPPPYPPSDSASRPFDISRCGFVPSEGGAMFMLEEREHALARGATILAEITGYGCSMDAHAMTAPHPEGVHAERAVRDALHEAFAQPETGQQAIDFVSAHGTSTPLNDAVEAAMLQRVFGSRPKILALKSWLGHGAAACGALELAMLLSTLPYGVVPHVRNLNTPCPESESLSFATSSPETPNTGHNAMSMPASNRKHTSLAEPDSINVLLENFGFGGQNAALVLQVPMQKDEDHTPCSAPDGKAS